MKTIVLTGANRGLGKALKALLLSPEFATDKKVFITRRPLRVNATPLVDHIALDLSALPLDLRCINLAPRTSHIVFINNAGVIDPIANATVISSAAAEAAMRVNCWAPLQIAQYLALQAQPIEAPLFILNVSSGAANKPIRGWLAYCVSKVAVKMALDVLASENGRVSVLHFDPGIMDTAMQETICAASESAMPDVGLFRAFKALNKLKAPTNVAADVGAIIRALRS
jgi:benzil reductase ((S)-benzoin forming)